MRRSYLPPTLLSLIFLLPLAHADISTLVSTVTQSASAAATPTPSSQYTNDTEFQNATLTGHNFFRDEHNATALTWNATSAKYAADWAAKCSFEHTGGPTGENLAAGYPNATASMDAWGTERNGYDFKAAQFTESTGHFTQVVWKSTSTVGCGRADCEGKGGTPGWYVVCEYYPPGNVIGAFAANVQAQIKGISDGTIEQGLGAAGMLKVEWAWGCAVMGAAGLVAMEMW